MFGPDDPFTQVFDEEHPGAVLGRAVDVDLSSVVMCGIRRSTGEFYFATSEGSMGDALVLLELAKKHCLDLVEERMRRAIRDKD